MGDEGLELRAVSKWKITDVVMGDAESDAFSSVSDRKLEALLQVWADLPESVKDALLLIGVGWIISMIGAFVVYHLYRYTIGYLVTYSTPLNRQFILLPQ